MILIWRFGRLLRSVLITASGVLALVLPFGIAPVLVEERENTARALLDFPEPFEDAAAAETTAWLEALERPVFSPNRRPWVPTEPQPEPEAPVPMAAVAPGPGSGPVELIGVFIHDAGQRALIKWSSSPEGEWLAVGSDVAGWKIVGIGADSVALSNSADARTLQLDVDNTSGE